MSADIDFDPFAGPALQRSAPTTEPQRELWAAVQMGADASCAFNESVSLDLEGPLDVAALERALADLVARHDALRSTFTADGTTLLVGEPSPVALELEDLSGLPPAEQDAGLRRALAHEVETAFDLQKGPLLRARLLRFGPERHRLSVTAHHVVCDGYSMAVMLKDVAALYTAHRTGRPAALPPAPAFADYAVADRAAEGTPAMAAAERYWTARFAQPPPPLDLPSDRPRPPAKTYASRREDVELPADLVERVKKVGAQAGCSFFTTLLAGFEVLLSRLSGQTDVVVGIPAAGQSFTGQAGLVGHCVNTLPLRSEVREDAGFLELARGVRGTMLDAYEHQALSFGALLRRLPLQRDPSRLPLTSLLFNVDQAVTGAQLPFEGLRVRFHSNPRHFENFDLFVNAAESEGRVVLECQYNTDLFDGATVRGWMACYERLLRAVVEDPKQAVGALALTPDAQLAQQRAWNAEAVRPFAQAGATVHGLMQARAAAQPDVLALVCAGAEDVAGAALPRLTHAQLHARADALASVLRARGVGRGTLVGLHLERSADMVVALLGVLKAGAAYVPLDPGFPPERLAFMVEDSRMALLLTQAALEGRLTVPAGVCVLVLDAATTREALAAAAPLAPDAARDARPEDPAYVIYTSGSTGRPKGVVVPHRSIVNFLLGVAEEPGLAPGDTLLAVTTLSFDIAVLELHLPLVTGARIVLASREVAQDGALLAAALQAHGVTVMQATPSTWRLLLAAGWTGGPAFKALCGGEALPKDLAQRLATACGAGLFNMYGPTETTVWSTLHRVLPGGPVLIGRPLPNQRTYVLDARGAPQPLGVAGELYIGGEGVTLGYLHREELTRERFLADPFVPGARMYRTGDVVRLRTDGQLEYLGRNDAQVKVRGYRIELGEIEAALAAHPAVAQAAALVREDRPGDVRLVGYVVHRPGLTSSDADLRAHLKRTLPEYMVPQHFVVLPALPLTPNGKVDRKALPPPAGAAAAASEVEFVAPRTDTERGLAAIWQQVLGVPRVGVHENFFTLGGHSLLAAQAAARIQRELGPAVGLRQFFEAPTIEKLAALVAGASARAAGAPAPASLPRRSGTGPAPLSLMQQRLWFLEQLDPGTVLFNLPSAFRIQGELDVAALEKAFNALVERHDTLRTTLRWEGDGPVQHVAPSLRVAVEAVDLSTLPAAEREAVLLERLHHEANQHIPVDTLPLFRLSLYRTGAREHVLFFMPHHAVWDGWSFDTFLRDLSELYAAAHQGRPASLPALPVRYQDFAEWHREWLRGPELERQAAYWRAQLAGELPTLELPTDRPRPEALRSHGATVPFALTAEEIASLDALAKRHGATLYMVLLAAFKSLLHRYTGQQDLVVGTPIRGRAQPETEDLIGFFVNTLVLRTQVDPQASFVDLLKRVRGVVLDAFSHQDMPFEQLLQELDVQRDPSRTPIYQAFFTFQDVSNRNTTFGDLPFSQVHVHSEVAPTDVSLWVKETGRGLVGGIDYLTDLFDRATMERFLAQYVQLLRSAVAAPERAVGELELLPSTERAQLAAWNAEAVREDLPVGLTAHALLEAGARAHADALALVCATPEDVTGERTPRLTHAQLHARADALARLLRARGVGRGSLVGLHLERSADMVVALLGVLKAGAAYVPLDPGFPPERLAFMVTDSRMALLLTQATLQGRLQAPAELAQLVLDAPETAAALAAQPAGPVEPDAARDARPEDPAYVIYTSGSTGQPKGVVVPHRSVVNFLQGVAEVPGLGERDVLLAVTTLSFDIAVLELYLPLVTGARVVLASRELASDGPLLKAALAGNGATVMQATPSTWRLLLAAGWEGGPGFKALCGGEALPKDLAQRLAAVCGAGLFNMYGPTETTVWSTVYRVPAAGSPVRIGRPLPNQSVHVLDAHLRPQPLGVPGELFIGGRGVTLGYLHREALTRERFLPDPSTPGGLLYRTGDVVRMLADGNLEYVGRNDAQVKVRGYRIELGEIEAALAAHAAVEHAAVLVREDRPGDVRIVAYVVHRGDEEASDNDLRKHLRRTLPDYMVPQHFVTLDALPLTPNGKLDRKALPAPGGLSAPGGPAFVAPRTAAEKLVADLWRAALGVDRVGAHDNFFNLGGHSLLCLQVVAQLERHTRVRLSPRVILLNSLQQIAAMLPEEAQKEAAPAAPEVEAQQGSLTQRLLGKLLRGRQGAGDR